MSSLARALRPLRRELQTTKEATPALLATFADDAGRDLHLDTLVTYHAELVLRKDSFKDVQRQYLAHAWTAPPDQTAADAQSEQDAELLTQVDTVIGDVAAAVRRLTAQREDDRTRAATAAAAGPAIAAAAPAPQRTNVRLPTLAFPVFNGDILKWTSFWHRFKAAVHNNTTMPAVEKLTFLLGQLDGDALQTIACLDLTDEAYPKAVEMLEERYGNTDTIIDSHYTALSELPAAVDLKTLRPLVDQLESHLNSLAALGEDVAHRQFTTLIKSKLPSSIRLQMEKERKDSDEDWSVDVLRGHLRSHLSLCEVVYNKAKPLGPANDDQATYHGVRFQGSTASDSTDDPQSEDSDPETTLLATSERSMLQTVTTTVEEPNGTMKLQARGLFDNGSQHSYITESVANQLQLPTKATTHLKVLTFGSQPVKQIETKVTEIRLRLKDGTTFPLIVNVVPTITGKIRRDAIDISRYPVLNGYFKERLADSVPSRPDQCGIDFLIGADYMWELLTMERTHIGRGLYLLNSKLGWLLCGRHHREQKDDNSSLLTATLTVINSDESRGFGSTTVDPSSPEPKSLWDLETIGIADPIHGSHPLQFRALAAARFFVGHRATMATKSRISSRPGGTASPRTDKSPGHQSQNTRLLGGTGHSPTYGSTGARQGHASTKTAPTSTPISMNLREWISNHFEFTADFPLTAGKPNIMGLPWDPKKDTFTIPSPPPFDSSGPIAKWAIMKHVAAYFDPIGVLCPAFLSEKAFLQHLREIKIDWDTPFDPGRHAQWLAFASTYAALPQECKSLPFIASNLHLRNAGTSHLLVKHLSLLVDQAGLLHGSCLTNSTPPVSTVQPPPIPKSGHIAQHIIRLHHAQRPHAKHTHGATWRTFRFLHPGVIQADSAKKGTSNHSQPDLASPYDSARSGGFGLGASSTRKSIKYHSYSRLEQDKWQLFDFGFSIAFALNDPLLRATHALFGRSHSTLPSASHQRRLCFYGIKFNRTLMDQYRPEPTPSRTPNANESQESEVSSDDDTDA